MNNILVKTTKDDTFDTKVACARTAQSLGRVLGYLEDANDITIDFIGLTDERRDLICKTDYTIASTKKALLRTSPSHGRKNTNAILCGSPIERLEEPVLDKLICHEIGHDLGPNIANKWTMATLYAGKYSTILLPWVASILTIKEPFGPSLSAVGLGYLASKHIAPLIYWPIRLEEKKADDFSDRMIPELTMRDALTQEIERSDRTNKLSEIIENEMVIQRFQHLFSSHPSFYTRYKRSDENCPLYLEQKKQLGIPSLVVG